MTLKSTYVCEAEVEGEWRPITLAQALGTYRLEPVR